MKKSSSDRLRWTACSLFSIHWDIETRQRCDHSQILDVQRPSSELLRAAPGCSQGLLFLLSVLSLGSAPQHRISLVDLVVRSDLMSLLWGYSAIVSLLALMILMILMITRVHILWCPGVNIKCNLNAGSQKRDVDALRSLSWRQSSAKFLEASRMRAGEVTVKLSLQGSWNPLRE